MYVPYSRVHQTKPRRPSEGGETVDQPVDSEIVIDPPTNSTFGMIGQKIYRTLDSMPDQQPIDSEATRPGTEADEAIARSGKRIEQTLDYVGHKVHDLLQVPPPEPSLSSEATRPGTEVDSALARVGKHIEEYLHAATTSGKSKAWQETSSAFQQAADSMEKVNTPDTTDLKHKATDAVDKTVSQVKGTASQAANKASETADKATAAIKSSSSQLNKKADQAKSSINDLGKKAVDVVPNPSNVKVTAHETIQQAEEHTKPTKTYADELKELELAADSKTKQANEPHSTLEGAAKWTKEAKDSLSGAAKEYYKSKKEGVSAYQHEKEARRTTGQEKVEHEKRAQEAREDQSAHVSNAQQHLVNLRTTSSPPNQGPAKEEGIFSRISNWLTGSK